MAMNTITLLVLCSAMITNAAAQWVAPAFYKTLEGPKFKVLKTLEDGIELRRYDPASWVSTKKEAMELDQAMSGSFMKLFNYISGANTAQAKIAMTAPVLTKIEPGEGPACNSKFTISFYNPYKYQSGTVAPASTDSAVFINNMPAMDVYVLSFGGMANGPMYKQKAAQLMQKLKDAKIPFNSKYWFTAGYDSPYTVINRHNEVWVPAAAAAAGESAAQGAKGQAAAGHKL